MTTKPSKDELLGAYLNDHLAGATAGAELIKRLSRAEAHRPEGETLRRLVAEIAEDRQALLDIMAALNISARQYKAWIGWTVEKLSRVKPNRHVLTRSPLSRVVELETMLLGVEGKSSGWRILRARSAEDTRLDADRLDELISRAERQVTVLEQLRLRSATVAFGGDAEGAQTGDSGHEDTR
jgi:hypothetical protein